MTRKFQDFLAIFRSLLRVSSRFAVPFSRHSLPENKKDTPFSFFLSLRVLRTCQHFGKNRANSRRADDLSRKRNNIRDFRPAMFHLTGRGLCKLTLPPADSRISKVASSTSAKGRRDKNFCSRLFNEIP